MQTKREHNKKHTIWFCGFILFLVVLCYLMPAYQASEEKKKSAQLLQNYNEGIELLKNSEYEKARDKLSDFSNKNYDNDPQYKDARYLYHFTLATLFKNDKNGYEYELIKDELAKIPYDYKGQFAKEILALRKEVESYFDKRKQEEIDQKRAIIRISKVITSEPNSAAGINLSIVWQNTSSKTIKYISFITVPFNAVNDPVKCSIRDRSEVYGKVTGPIESGQWYGENSYWDSIWYNNTIKRAELRSIDIEYMDGTKVSLSGEDVKYVQY